MYVSTVSSLPFLLWCKSLSLFGKHHHQLTKPTIETTTTRTNGVFRCQRRRRWRPDARTPERAESNVSNAPLAVRPPPVCIDTDIPFVYQSLSPSPSFFCFECLLLGGHQKAATTNRHHRCWEPPKFGWTNKANYESK